jgi:hypothetical protein
MSSTQVVCRWLVVSALAVSLSSVVFADPPAGKNPNANQAAAPGGSAAQTPPEYRGPGSSQERYDDQNHNNKDDWDDANRGQVVSECNHRANQRNMKSKDRQEFLEWCTEHGARYKYDDRYYDREDRSCYHKADEKGLSGDKRRHFINECIRKHEVKRGEAGVGTYGEPRGRDVLGKGSSN